MLATLEFLAASGLDPTVSALECGHSYYTSSGNVSEHSSGNAVDIAAINGIPIVGHQGPGSITDITISRLLTLQGTLKPHQIISLMTFQGADNTLALPDHYDHIHVGFQPLFGSNPKLSQQLNSVLQPGQWLKLMDRLGQIPNPTVPLAPSKFSIDVKARPILTFDRHDHDRVRFGALEFRSGLVLTSPFPRFGGLSGLRLDASGERFISFSDHGHWFTGRIVCAEWRQCAASRGSHASPIWLTGRAVPGRDVVCMGHTADAPLALEKYSWCKEEATDGERKSNKNRTCGTAISVYDKHRLLVWPKCQPTTHPVRNHHHD